MKIYIAGPMTGHPQFNYPAFNRAAIQLRSYGIEVINPAENSAPNENPMPHEWMRLCIPQVLQADAIAVLPGWKASKGAKLEVDIADALMLEICSVEEWVNRLKATKRLAPGRTLFLEREGERQKMGTIDTIIRTNEGMTITFEAQPGTFLALQIAGVMVEGMSIEGDDAKPVPLACGKKIAKCAQQGHHYPTCTCVLPEGHGNYCHSGDTTKKAKK